MAINTKLDNKIAVAKPLVLKIACRSGTMIKRPTIAIKFNLLSCSVSRGFLCDTFKCLGIKEVVPMGHMLRHKPVATTSNKGAIGIKMFQNK